jgi:uncharacterized membrane protein YbhN (UPF0104 family)
VSDPIPPRRPLAAAARLVLGLLLFAGVVWWLLPGPAEREAALARAELHPRWLLAAFAATTVACLVTSARWKRMAEAMGGTVLPHAVYFHALALTRVLGQLSSSLVMDLVGRGVLLRAAGSQRGLGHAITQAVLERVLDLVLPLLLVAWALAVRLGGWSDRAAALSFAALGLAFALASTLALAPLTRLALRLYAAALRLRARLRRDASPLPELDVPAIPRALALQVGLLGLARHLAVTAQFWALAAAVGATLTAFEIAAATPIGLLGGMLGVTPGALGIQEAGWTGALTWLRVDPGAVALFVLSHRVLLTAAFAVLALLSWPLARPAPKDMPPGP